MKRTSSAFEQARLRHVLVFGLLEHHREEVLGEVEVVVRVDVGQAHVVPVGEGGEGRHLGDQADGGHVALFGVADLLRVRVEGRERADAGQQHPHRVGVVAEALEELLQVLVDVGVVGDVEHPAVELRLGRQLAEDQQVGDLEEGGALAELLDRVAAVFEDPGGAVDVGDRGAAGGGVGEGRVVGHQPEFVLGDFDLAQVDAAHGAVLDRQLVGLAGAVVGDGQGLGGSSSAAHSVQLRSCRAVKRPWRLRGRQRLELGHPAQRLERPSISSRLRRETRSVPNSSTLKEASTVP